MEKKWTNLQSGETTKSKIALASAVVMGFTFACGASSADIKCEDIEYEVQFNVNEAYNELFEKLINSTKVNSLSSAEYSVLMEYVTKTQQRIIRNLTNGEKVAIDDTYNYSPEIDDEVGRQINNEMYEKVVGIYDGIFQYDASISNIRPNGVEIATNLMNDLLKFGKDNKNSLLEGSRWAFKNAIVAYLTELYNLYSSMGMDMGIEADGISGAEFRRIIFAVFDEEEFNKNKMLVPKADIDVDKVLSKLGCQCKYKAFINTILEIIKATKTVNEEFNINKCGNVGAVIIDEDGIHVIGDGSNGRVYIAQTLDDNYRVSRRA